MTWPVDIARAPLNTRAVDAFGADTGGRKVPHTGIDFGGASPVFSVYAGVVTDSYWDREAGWSVIVEEFGRGRWRGFGHLFARGVPVGTVLAAGDLIGITGSTGTGANGTHLHTWEATSLDAARRILNGFVNVRRWGESVAQWAAGMGLVDPLPSIRASLKATAPATPPPLPEPRKEVDDVIILNDPVKYKLGVVFVGGNAAILTSTQERYDLVKAGVPLVTVSAQVIDGLIDESRKDDR